MIEPPGKVLHVARARSGRGQVAYVSIEVPKMRRRLSLTALAKRLGPGAKKALLRDGLVKNKEFAETLLRYWVK